MPHAMDDSKNGALTDEFERCLQLEFHDTMITSDAGLLAYRAFDAALGLSETAGSVLVDQRCGKNKQHLLTGLPRPSLYGRLANYADVSNANRLSLDPAKRDIIDRRGSQ